MNEITIIGGGLAGVEATWQAANAGAVVRLCEMRPVKQTPAHRTDRLAEIVCSNSLKSDQPYNASWLLKEELRRLGSILIQVADSVRVPAGSADRAAALVSGLGLPARVAKQCAASELLAIMRRDKKASGGLSFILPSADGLSMVHDPPPAALDAAMEAVGVPTST